MPEIPENFDEAADSGLLQPRLVRHLLDALKRIAECEDAPDIDIGGEARIGLHCGVEDRSCSDRYEGADYGYSCGVERGLEWAVNEAKHALDSLPNDSGVATAPQTPGS